MAARGIIVCLSTLICAASASSSWAETSEKVSPAAGQVQALQSDIDTPEEFKRYIEGSLPLPEGFPVPTAPGRQESLHPFPPRPMGLQPAPAALRPEDALPPPMTVEVPRYATFAKGAPPGGLLLMGLAFIPLTALGLFALAGAQGSGPLPGSVEQTPEPKPAAPQSRRPWPNRPVTISPLISARPAPPEPVRNPPSTEMPAATWRAISGQEQRLIDQWDSSPEKAAGMASLEEWLEARGATAGVDVARLKAKLSRDV